MSVRSSGAPFAVLCTTLLAFGCVGPPVVVPVASFERIASPSGAYSVTPALGGWAIAQQGPSSSFDGDIVLVNEELGVAVSFYVEQGTTTSLDDYVLRRREQISQRGEIVTLDERRSFQVGSDFTTVSISTYRVRWPGADGWSPIISGVIRGPTATVEVHATGGTFPHNTKVVEDLIAGVRFSQDPQSLP